MPSETSGLNKLLLTNSWLSETDYEIYQGSRKYFYVSFTTFADRVTNKSMLLVNVSVSEEDYADIDYILGTARLKFSVELISNIGESSKSENIYGADAHYAYTRLLQKNNSNGEAPPMTVVIKSWIDLSGILSPIPTSLIPLTHTITIPTNKFPTIVNPKDPLLLLETIDTYRCNQYDRLKSRIEKFVVRYNYDRDYRDNQLIRDGMDVCYGYFNKNLGKWIERPKFVLELDDGLKNQRFNMGSYPSDIDYLVFPTYSSAFDFQLTKWYPTGLYDQRYELNISIYIYGWVSCMYSFDVIDEIKIFNMKYILPTSVVELKVDKFDSMLLTDLPKKVDYYLSKDPNALGEIENKEVSFSSSSNDVATISSTGIITPIGYGHTTITVKALDDRLFEYGDGLSESFTIFISGNFSFPYFQLYYKTLNVTLMNKIINAVLFFQSKIEYVDDENFRHIERDFIGYAQDVRTIFQLLTDTAYDTYLFVDKFLDTIVPYGSQQYEQYEKIWNLLDLHRRQQDCYVTRENINWYGNINYIIECLQMMGNIYEHPNSVVDGCYIRLAETDPGAAIAT